MMNSPGSAVKDSGASGEVDWNEQAIYLRLNEADSRSSTNNQETRCVAEKSIAGQCVAVS